MEIEEGLPPPLGATWNGRGTNFAVFSANATKVEVGIFDSLDGKEICRVELPEYTDQIFHGFLADAREPSGFDEQSGFLKACNQDPKLAKIKLIAEPLDCGPGGYQVGAFPPGWAEWNDKFRHVVRDYLD